MNRARLLGLIAIAAAASGSVALFLMELVAAKLLTPRFGGSPSVWLACLAFFQTTLVAGYLTATTLARRLGMPAQVAVLALLVGVAIVVMPAAVDPSYVAPPRGVATISAASWWPVVVELVSLVGLPFLAAAAIGPLLGHWLAVRTPGGATAYRLSAAGNAASAAVLVAYPAVLEPWVGLRGQWGWLRGAFMTAACLALVSGWLALRGGARHRQGPVVAADGLRSRAFWTWVALAAIPASWLSGVTAHVTVEVAPIPLLWIVPLAASLASFAIVFAPGGRALRAWEPAMLAAAITTTTFLLATGMDQPAAMILPLHLGAFFVACIALHGRLFDERPPPAGLTDFCVAMGVGGACGGLFNALVAPAVFDARHEYPLAVAAAAAFVATVPRWLRQGPLPVAVAGVAIGGFFAGEFREGVIDRTRGFFGVLRVCEESNGPSRSLRHDGILHGVQLVSSDAARRGIPLAYYHESGPLGSVFLGVAATGPIRQVGVAGLGIGTIAAYGRPGQRFTFYEIDPDVARIAGDGRWFSFLDDCRADVRVVVDDARAAIAREPDGGFDLLVIDAFTGDAVPSHLLTREALELFATKTAVDGCVAMHISNRFLDLEPVVASAAEASGWMAILARDDKVPADYARTGSRWMVLCRSRDRLRAIYERPTSDLWRWVPAPARGGRAWTDDRAPLAEALVIGRR
jgi:spermidine synthase